MTNAITRLGEWLLRFLQARKQRALSTVGKILVIGGVGSLSTPFWVPIAEAVLKREYQLELPNSELMGIVLIAGGVLLVIADLAVRHHESRAAGRDAKAQRNASLLQQLFTEMDIGLIEANFEAATESCRLLAQVLPVFHTIEPLVRSSKFQLTDTTAKEHVDRFIETWNISLGFGLYMEPDATSTVLRFMQQQYLGPFQRDEIREDFVRANTTANAALQDLVAFVAKHYPTVDLR